MYSSGERKSDYSQNEKSPPEDFQPDVEECGETITHGLAGELRALREAEHGQVATAFYEFDADGSGYLDESEIGAFSRSLGVLLTDAEVAQALDEMELDSTRDGKIDFDEFVAWWASESKTKRKGSVAFRLQKAKEQAFQTELAASSPMGQLLSLKQATRAESAGDMHTGDVEESGISRTAETGFAGRAQTPPRKTAGVQSRSAHRRSGTPPRSTHKGASVVPVQPPALDLASERQDANAVAMRRAAAAKRLAAHRRSQTPPRP